MLTIFGQNQSNISVLCQYSDLFRYSKKPFLSTLFCLLLTIPVFAQFEGQIAQVCDGNNPSKVYATAVGSPSGSWELFNISTNSVIGTGDNGEYIESTAFSVGNQLEIRDASNTNSNAGIINVPEWGGGNPAQNYTTGNANSGVGCSEQLVCGVSSDLNIAAKGFADGFSNSNTNRLLAANSLNGTHNGSFNALIFGNFNSDGSADTEGRFAVSGNFIVPGSSYSIGTSGASGADDHAPFGWDNLIVGGNMDFGGRIRGNVLFQNNSSGRLPGFDGIGSGSSGMYRNYTPDIDWNNAQTHLKNLSTSLSSGNLSISHTVGSVSGSINLTLDGNNATGVVVFNISSLPNTNTSFNFINVGNADFILVNIELNTYTQIGGSIQLNGNSFSTPLNSSGKSFVEKTLWNFSETSDFELTSFLIPGSVLAPFTTDVSLNGGSINGQAVFSGDVQHSGSFEFHNFCFTKSSYFDPPDETLTLTQRNCWRMLSSPFQNLTYNDIIGSLWTQGVTGSDSPAPETSVDFTNIYVWDKSNAGNTDSGWSTSGLDLNQEIPEGEGFLMSIFEDDNYDGEIQPSEEFDKEIVISGTPYSGTNISPNMNQNDDGWTLVGNPFNDAVDFGYMVSNNLTNELTNVAYVYNINASGSSNPNTNGNPGGWVSTDGSIGDLHDGKIAVFQGFFVQNNGSANNPSITFTDAARTTGATFYGKENKRDKDYVRLELNGEGVYNSAWITFSDAETSTERMIGDAYELVPFTDKYALFGSKKGDEIFDIGQFSNNVGKEIPLQVETTSAGIYTITATDLSFSQESNLIFKDNQKNVHLNVDENFEYQFTIDQVAKTGYGITPLVCGATGDQLAKTFTPIPAKAQSETNRFSLYIAGKKDGQTNLPTEYKLNQNYPNPFNPTTVIQYQLPANSAVLLEVYDLVGRKVATLVNEQMTAGTHTVNFDASNISSGIYIYNLRAGSTALTRKLTVIK